MGPPPPSDSLPAPVARYFVRVLPASPVPFRTAVLEQEGELRTEPDSSRWFQFRARHVITPDPPGFVWDARVRLGPLLHLRVRDALLAGRGSGEVALWSAFPIASAGGRAEVNAGSLHRFLAEAVWCPTALLPSSGLEWQSLDDNTALAKLTESDTTVSLEFRFNPAGEIVSVYTPARWGRFRGRYEERPWEGHFRDYREQGGMLVPAEGEVGWYVGDRLELVWRGGITRAAYR